MSRRPPRAALGWTVFGVAFLLRAAWVLYRWSTSGPEPEFSDGQLHLDLATNLIERGEFVSDDGHYAARMPLYPLFLASCTWLGPAGVLVARLAQAAIGALTAWVAFVFCDAALGRRAAWVAGASVCFDPYAIFFANLLLTEVLFTLIGVGLVACAWHVADGGDRVRRIAVGGVAALGAAAVMTRPSAVGWVLLLWLVLGWMDRNRRRAAWRSAIYAVTLAAALLPWGLRNRAALGSFAWLSTNGGVTLYDAQGPQADGSSNQAFLDEMPELGGLSEVEQDRRLRDLALTEMKRDGVRVLQLACVKFLRTWSPVPNVAAYRGGKTGLASAAFMALVVIAASIGIVRTRKRTRLHALLWLPIVYFTLLHCIYIGSLRYRVPLMPFLEITAAAAFVASAGSGRVESENQVLAER